MAEGQRATAEGQHAAQVLVAGRYWPQRVVHREEGRACWLGQDVPYQRPVSLVESRAATVRAPGESPRRAAGRIMRRSEAMGRLCPGRVTTVVDVVEDDGALWTVLERIEGAPLSDLLRLGPVDPVRAARIGLGLLDVLAAAHREGITHGDLSPGQVFLRPDGEVVVAGFGLRATGSSPRATAPSYASPEQARGEAAGPETDLWALGAILYTMVEGRPPVEDWGTVPETLRAVGRSPVPAPANAGPLGPAVQGLLRRDPRERLTEPVVRAALGRILREDPAGARHAAPLRDAYAAARRRGRVWGRRTVGRPALLGTALAVVGASLAVLALTTPDSDDGASASAPVPLRPSRGPAASASLSATPSPAPSRSPSPSASSPAPSASSSGGQGLPSGFHVYAAPEGFSVALPDGWGPVERDGSPDVSYRVTFGASGDPRRLAITYSERLGPDPVQVWQELEPSLRRASDRYERVGEIRSVAYRGLPAADMEWLATGPGGVRDQTLGRGFLIGPGRGFSFRWTTPADEWDDARNRRALDVYLRSFEAGTG
ncbi:serine/threonine-protein kinase [Streptomyces sp. NPDC059786]|uniref:serine/threonine-protein kinase n=1 Tax=Streptomyces sp. NPDC059786 TaxID=3346946 RepID=UPI0036524E62